MNEITQSDDDRVIKVPVNSIRPTPENWGLYRKPAADDQFPILVEGIREVGIRTPISISDDLFILSGHRRHAAAQVIGLKMVPVIRESVRLGDLSEAERTVLVAQYNKGTRVKTAYESISEAMLEVDAEQAIRDAQNRKANVFAKMKTSPDRVIVTTTGSRRTDPRGQRGEFLGAVMSILLDLKNRDMLPTSERHIHYKLLGVGPRVSKGVLGNIYGTDPTDSKKLSKLLTDARSAGIVPYDWITDETRGEYFIEHSGTIGDYVAKETATLFQGYFSNVHADQSVHLEIMVEKNTMFPLIQRHVAHPLRIPVTSGRGYSSAPVGYKIAERFRASGKQHLVIVTVCDLDPEGYDMPEALKKYLKIDHGIDAEVRRAGITPAQVKEHNLLPCTDAKKSSSRFKNFVKNTGLSEAWELDALDPAFLVDEVNKMCRSLLVIDALNSAFQREKEADVKLAMLQSVLAKQIPELMRQIETGGAA